MATTVRCCMSGLLIQVMPRVGDSGSASKIGIMGMTMPAGMGAVGTVGFPETFEP